MGITMIDAGDLGDVAAMLRRVADAREAEVDALPSNERFACRDHLRRLREAADYHERQAIQRREMNTPA